MSEMRPGKRKVNLWLIALLAAALIRFVHLGFLDMQAWDEALYAVRAETILQYGLFLDQTPRAIDGLYSSLHPPLYVWLTALSYEVFGVNEFAARFFAALFGALTVFLIYEIGILLRNERTGLVAALLYGLTPITLFYSRQGQFDAALVFFLSLAIYLLLKGIREESKWFVSLAGLATGAALMSKLFVGFAVPLAMLAWILTTERRRQTKSWIMFGIVCAGTVVVAAPWHVYMTVVHGDGDPLFFLHASALVERATSGIEGNIKPLGPLYFVNQLFVVFPFGAFWFLHGLPSGFRKADQSWYLTGLWFMVLFVTFSLMRTQLEVYILPMLVAGALFAGRSIDRALNGELSGKSVLVLLTGTALSVAWSASQDWRNAVKGTVAALSKFSAPLPADLEHVAYLALVCLIIVAAVAYLWNNADVRYLQRAVLPGHFIPMAVVALVIVAVLDTTRYVDGGSALARFINDRRIGHLVVAGFERNPQLSYYLRGADIGWESELWYERIIPPTDETRFGEWLEAELAPIMSGTLVVLEKDKFVRHKVIDPKQIMPEGFFPVFESRRYSAWMRNPDDTRAELIFTP